MAKIVSMPAAVYHADCCPQPSLSASIIHLLCSASPWHAWTAHPRLNPQYQPEDSERMDIGTIAHAILLEGADVAAVLDFPDWRTKESRAARDETRAGGKVPILSKHWNDVLAMTSAARIQLDQHRDGKRAFTDGKPEQVLLWEEDGIYCRARLDWLMNDRSAIFDYKTTGASANPDVISRTLFQSGYDIQAAWYARGLKAVSDCCYLVDPAFRFIYQETYPPYALSVIALGPDSLMLAEKKVMFAMDVWRTCMEEDKWPGYPRQTAYVSVPVWMEEQWLAKETQIPSLW